MNMLPSLWPGEVASYDPVRRTCRVRIPGITDGSDTLPEAVFSNPLGDRADVTEIRIDAGDMVWLMFEGGDPRFPIITGYRTPRAGNPTDWRRWRHANIELTANGVLRLNAHTIELNATTFTTNADTATINATTTVNGDTGLNGSVAAAGGGLTHDGVNVGATHVHGGVVPGVAKTAVPE